MKAGCGWDKKAKKKTNRRLLAADPCCSLLDPTYRRPACYTPVKLVNLTSVLDNLSNTAQRAWGFKALGLGRSLQSARVVVVIVSLLESLSAFAILSTRTGTQASTVL